MQIVIVEYYGTGTLWTWLQQSLCTILFSFPSINKVIDDKIINAD